MVVKEQNGQERRRFLRVPLERTVELCTGPEAVHSGICTDIGHGGINIEAPANLRAGQLVLVNFRDAAALRQIKARVAWARETETPGKAAYQAGLRTLYDEPDALASVSELLHGAVTELQASNTNLPMFTVDFGMPWFMKKALAI
ncbi:MAG: hypothetical protein KJ052_09045 [Candidatus Hydrogenedentes bacterium]|nr:hypothetical protein [Candidatus Hydrogenedentota bacterium]